MLVQPVDALLHVTRYKSLTGVGPEKSCGEQGTVYQALLLDFGFGTSLGYNTCLECLLFKGPGGLAMLKPSIINNSNNI